MDTRVGPLLTVCLLLSGAAALVYEVVWLRALALVMGHTVYALATVLTAFLGGLALGAYVGGRWTARHGASMHVYAGIELAIAVSAVAMPWAIDLASPLFGLAYRTLGNALVPYNLVQFVICGVLLLVPTVLIGATLPVVSALLAAEGGGLARSVGRLYAANSLGGALGAGLGGYWLLPQLGMARTALAAGGLNLLVAGAAWAAGRRVAGGARTESLAGSTAPGAWPAPSPTFLVLLYALAGFASLALEVAWARLVTLAIGSTVYGFTMTILTFIVGLALGSHLVPRLAFLARDPVRTTVVLQCLIAVWSVGSLRYLGALPVRAANLLGEQWASFWALLGAEHLLVGATILVPTIAMGGTFPLVTAVLHRSIGRAGHAVGSAYAANTVGNIAGSFIAGFVLVPYLGMRTTIVLSAALNGVVGAGFLLPALRQRRAPAGLVLGVLVAALLALGVRAPEWDREVLTSAPYLYGRTLRPGATPGTAATLAEATQARFGPLLDYREGATAVVSVRGQGQRLSLQINGKSDAFSFASTQNLVAHLPLLIHAHPETVLVVGLGGGSTLASVLTHPVREVVSVEISPEVYAMARRHFLSVTGGALDDPRSTVIVSDARNHLRHTRDAYDVIISQPSNPWMSGSASLFTREFFADLRRHLRPGGIACAWFMASGDEEDVMGSVLRTWSDVFDDAYLFESRLVGEYILLGLTDGRRIAAASVAARLARAEVARDLARLHVGEPADVLGFLLLGPAPLRAYAAEATINTDDNARIEFRAPRRLGAGDPVAVLAGLHRHRRPPHELIDAALATHAASAALVARLDAIFRSKEPVLRALALEATGGRGPEWRAALAEAAALNPRDPYVMAWMP